MSGQLIGGRYRLRDLVGKGGFGAVYVADQVGMDRPVALKVLHQQRMDSASRDRFEREARLAQRLEHPNTVRLLDFGCEGSDVPYIAFELLRGTSLAATLAERGAMPPQRVARITSQVLKSLMEAHSLGIIHRDIKPANLFITAHAGEPDFCKVLDFGIAKTLESQSKVLTNAGEVVGTPAYMAPEAITGRPLSPASDLYSLGIVMAEMLSGKRLLQGSAVEIMQQHVSPEPLALAEAVTRGPLSEIVRRATAKDPAQRYPDAATMLRDIEALGPNLDASSLAPPAAATSLAETRPLVDPSLRPAAPVAVAATLSATQPAFPPPPPRGAPAASRVTRGLVVGAVLAFGIVVLVAAGSIAFLVLAAADPPPPLPRPPATTPERTVSSPPTRVAPSAPPPTSARQATPAPKPKPAKRPCYAEELTPEGIKVMKQVPCAKDFGY